MNERTCIVTRENGTPQNLIRFVVSPSGALVPDIKGNLPGRGAWVKARRSIISDALSRNAFQRSLQSDMTVSDGLMDLIDRLLLESSLQSLAMARKAGQVTSGAQKVESAIRAHKAAMVLHAVEAAEDGRRKIMQALHSVGDGINEDVPVVSIFTADELGLAFGDNHVIHAAVLHGAAAESFMQRTQKLLSYREKTD